MFGSATLGRAFVTASVLWALALPLAPFAVVQIASVHAWSAFVIGVYAFGSLVCHQLPQRSFHLWSVPLPVCARCTGIYAGAAMAAVVASVRPHPIDAGGFWRRAVIVAAMPTAATLGYEWATTQTPANWIRASAGLPLGAVVALIVVNACAAGAPRDKVSKVN
jgi:uncharacterized membrane protein